MREQEPDENIEATSFPKSSAVVLFIAPIVLVVVGLAIFFLGRSLLGIPLIAIGVFMVVFTLILRFGKSGIPWLYH